MITAIFSLIGILIGGYAQYFFTRNQENIKHQRDLRSKAYLDYIDFVCCAAMKNNTKENNKKGADAKARICLYGSPDVIKAYADFEKSGASLYTNEQMQRFAQMVLLMRSSSGNEKIEDVKLLEIMLFGSEKKDIYLDKKRA
ncbi:hypothetical protein KCM76_25285 [Zooshikella marina]|uniref:hypothetical protein n=1 Tax=Zooshikella ganghwensis TaxID=202772 RepID=UPI001BB043A0|nr:hypothetical protein [Zooshikella ganghwensis]MBU2709334.1 hypothetical protein [Zooshikella ganghwensis]